MPALIKMLRRAGAVQGKEREREGRGLPGGTLIQCVQECVCVRVLTQRVSANRVIGL